MKQNLSTQSAKKARAMYLSAAPTVEREFPIEESSEKRTMVAKNESLSHSG